MTLPSLKFFRTLAWIKLHFPGFPPINVAIFQSLLLGPSLIPGPSRLEYRELFWTLCFPVLHTCPKKCHPLLTLITTWYADDFPLCISSIHHFLSSIIYLIAYSTSAYFKFNMLKIEVFFFSLKAAHLLGSPNSINGNGAVSTLSSVWLLQLHEL